jgi:tRNA pseudouridine32 synthase/23S rRNA pseudouridine746 synthase
MPEAAPPHRPDFEELDVVHLDDHLIVLYKPAGLLAVPGLGADKQDCLSSRVQASYRDALVVHRLDMSTSGLMLMARSMASQRSLNKAFADRLVQKRYIAVVSGAMRTPEPGDANSWSLIDLPIMLDWPRRPLRIIDHDGGKPSQTRWQIQTKDQSQDRSQNLASVTTRVLLEPVTGRSHQLRVHLKAIGHAIVGDQLYASPEIAASASRLLLHATALSFLHPESGEMMRFQSPPPF